MEPQDLGTVILLFAGIGTLNLMVAVDRRRARRRRRQAHRA